MRSTIIKQLISRSRGITEAEKYSAYNMVNIQSLYESAKTILSDIPPSFGQCALMSACWAGYLQDHYSIPAIVVVGDLKVKGSRVFKCKNNLPESTNSGKFIINNNWNGHCWIEIDGIIGDLSIFRTAYAIDKPSILKDFIVSNFGYGRGAMVCHSNDLPESMQYVPKFVLKDNQINGLLAGLRYQIENDTGIYKPTL